MSKEGNDSFWALIEVDAEKVEKEIETRTIKALKQSPSKFRDVAVTKAHEKFNAISSGQDKRSAVHMETENVPPTNAAKQGKRERTSSKGRSEKAARGSGRSREKREGSSRSERRVKWKKPEEERSERREVHDVLSIKDLQFPKSGEMKTEEPETLKDTAVKDTAVKDTAVKDIVVKDAAVAETAAPAPAPTTNGEAESDTNKKESKLKFRWFKSLPLNADLVKLSTPFAKNAIPLKWCQEKQSFESEDLIVPCGIHTCKLSADGSTYGLEPVDVKFYTFEVDLYIEEENEPVPPPEEKKAEPTVSVKTGSSGPSTPGHTPSPRPKPPEANNNLDLVDAGGRPPASQHPLVVEPRHERMEEDFDGDSSVRSEGGSSIRRLEHLVRQQMVSANGPHTEWVPEPGKGDTSRPGRGQDGGYRVGGDRHYPDPDFRPIPPGHVNGQQERVGEWVARSGLSSGRQSASSEQELAGFLDQGGAGRRSHERLDAHRSTDRLSDTGRYEQDGSRRDHHSGRRGADEPGRRGEPDPVRRSASQEFEPAPRGSEPRFSSPRTSPGPARRSPYTAGGEQDHHASYSSLPPMSPISQRPEPGRREEPEPHRGSQPSLRSPLVTSRTTPISSRSVGQRHAPLAPLSTGQQEESSGEGEKEKDAATRMHDLEDTVLSLRGMLDERDREIELVKATRDAAAGDSREPRPVLSMSEQEKRVDDLIREKENMATEIWRLQQKVTDAEARPAPAPAPQAEPPVENGHGGPGEESGNLDNYSPNNPRALGRRLDELSGQLQDLQETNESVVSSLHASERKIAELTDENKALRMQRPYDAQDIEDENSRLRDELTRLREEALQGYSASAKKEGADFDSGFFRDEVSQLRNDLRVLRDKNHQLVQDNIKLTEHLKDQEVRRDSYRRGEYVPDRATTTRPSYGGAGRTLVTPPPRPVPAAQPERVRRDPSPLKAQDVYREVQSRRETSSHHRLPAPVSPASSGGRRSGGRLPDRDLGGEREPRMDAYRESRQESPSYRTQTDLAPRHPPVNGYDRDADYPTPHVKERRNSGRSDTTEILMSAPLGGLERDYEADDRSRRYQPAEDLNDTDKTLEFVEPELTLSSRDTVEDVLDDLPGPPRTAAYRRSKVVEDVTEGVPPRHAAAPRAQPTCQTTPPSRGAPLSGASSTYSIAHSITHSSAHTSVPSSVAPGRQTVSPGGSWRTPPAPLTRAAAQGDPYRQETGGMHRYPAATGPDTYTLPELSPLDPPNLMMHEHLALSDLSPADTRLFHQGELIDDFLGPPQRCPAAPHPSHVTHTSPVSKRRDSIDSGSTESILHEADVELQRSFTGSSCNKDAWSGRAHSDHLAASPPGTPPRSRSPHATGNFRSVNSKPIPTQRSKSTSDAKKSTFTTCGRRPFAPRSPADVNINDIVKFSRQGGKISKGLVKYIGHLPGKNDTYVGVELEQEMGKHDGVYEEQRYFQCKHNRGCFVAFSKVVMAWGD